MCADITAVGPICPNSCCTARADYSNLHLYARQRQFVSFISRSMYYYRSLNDCVFYLFFQLDYLFTSFIYVINYHLISSNSKNEIILS